MSIDELGKLFNFDESSENSSEKCDFTLVARGVGPFREKYRPQRIEEIVPTCSIDLLRNQIDNPNASQIYLFEGSTGTGKTTCARIIAKAANCLANNTFDKPCLDCDNCLSFDKSFDKLELNAANKNKVEDFRDLVDNMQYRPSIYPYKVYILDEVQRLTAAAQQVLLTELEEPHPYLLVFLCTTNIKDINKALAHRACRVTFNKLTPKHARDVIKQVAKLEKKQISDEVIEYLYYQSQGSVRELLNNIQSYFQDGFDPTRDLDEDVDADVKHLFNAISKPDWEALSRILKRPNVRKDAEVLRRGLENYMRAVILNTKDLGNASRLGNALFKISGSLISEPSNTQYNMFVLKCLRACISCG